MIVRADFHIAAVLAFVAVGIHVADDGELDLAHRVGELRHRADADHLMHRRSQRDVCARHSRNARAPNAATDYDGVGADVAARRPHAGNAPVFDIQAGDLGLGIDGQRAHLLRFLAHQRAAAQ